MNRTELERLYADIAPTLAALSEPWCVIGSGAMMIAGLPVEDCPDLDIMTTGAGAAAIEAAWGERRHPTYVPAGGDRFRSRFTRYDFPAGRVELMGDLEVDPGDGWRPAPFPAGRDADFAGRAVRIATAEELIGLLELFGRPKDLAKAGMIRRTTAAP